MPPRSHSTRAWLVTVSVCVAVLSVIESAADQQPAIGLQREAAHDCGRSGEGRGRGRAIGVEPHETIDRHAIHRGEFHRLHGFKEIGESKAAGFSQLANGVTVLRLFGRVSFQ